MKIISQGSLLKIIFEGLPCSLATNGSNPAASCREKLYNGTFAAVKRFSKKLEVETEEDLLILFVPSLTSFGFTKRIGITVANLPLHANDIEDQLFEAIVDVVEKIFPRIKEVLRKTELGGIPN